MFDNMSSAIPNIKAGRVRALGVASLKRYPGLPDLPTIAEAGVKGYETTIWIAQFAPAKTPPAVVSILIASTFVWIGAGAGAQTLNCNRDFAQVGDSKFTILQKCGEPVFKDSFCKKPDAAGHPFIAQGPSGGKGRVIINQNACEPVEEWTYRPGSGQFVTLLQFENGALKSIRYAGRIP